MRARVHFELTGRACSALPGNASEPSHTHAVGVVVPRDRVRRTWVALNSPEACRECALRARCAGFSTPLILEESWLAALTDSRTVFFIASIAKATVLGTHAFRKRMVAALLANRPSKPSVWCIWVLVEGILAGWTRLAQARSDLVLEETDRALGAGALVSGPARSAPTCTGLTISDNALCRWRTDQLVVAVVCVEWNTT